MKRILLAVTLLIVCAAGVRAQVQGERPFGRPGEEARGELVAQDAPTLKAKEPEAQAAPAPCPNPDKVKDGWQRFVCLWNDSSATREFTDRLNRANDLAREVSNYERRLIVSAGDDRKVLLDELAATLAVLARLTEQVRAEAEAQVRALSAVKR